MSRLLALVLSLLLPAAAWGQGVVRSSRSCSASATSSGSASLNAVLYAAMDIPGDYASGSTALAVDGSGTPVAMTITRTGAKQVPDVPNQGWWRSVAANHLAVGGSWTGALIDAPGTNLFGTPTDSPTSSGNWSLIAAGPTVTANSSAVNFLDGTATTTAFTEAAGVVSGLRQTVTPAAGTVCQHYWFQQGSPARDYWGFAYDGVTMAKFNIKAGYVSYCPTYPDCSSSSATVKAGVFHGGAGWVMPWACWTATAAAHTFDVFATSTGSDATIAATGGTALTYIARAMLEHKIAFVPAQVSAYTPAGTTRGNELLSFPVTFPDGNVCIGTKMEPYGSSWTARATTDVISAYGATVTQGAANSMWVQLAPTSANFWVYDNTATVKQISMTLGTYSATTPRDVMACTTPTGAMSLYVDGSIATNVSGGAGTGILTTPPTSLFIGSIAGSGNFVQPGSAAYSDIIACGAGAAGNPLLCGKHARPARVANLVLGDSIVAGIQTSGVTQPWSYVAAATAGVNIAQNSRAGWSTTDCLNAYQANRNHRWKRVAVLCGTNDISATTFDNLRQIYSQIIQDGAIPLPMTILPRGATGQTEINRLNINASIRNWGADNGYPVLDASACMDDPANTGHLRAADDSGDGLHPNQTGHTRLGGCATTYFQ